MNLSVCVCTKTVLKERSIQYNRAQKQISFSSKGLIKDDVFAIIFIFCWKTIIAFCQKLTHTGMVQWQSHLAQHITNVYPKVSEIGFA